MTNQSPQPPYILVETAPYCPKCQGTGYILLGMFEGSPIFYACSCRRERLICPSPTATEEPE